MKVLQCSLTIICLIFLFYRVGILIKNLLKREDDDIFNIIVNGFIVTFAIFEIIALPFQIFNLHIWLLYYIEIVIFLLIIILSFVLNWKKRTFNKSFKEYIKFENKKAIITLILLFCVIGMQVFLSSYLYNSNADDSFYISWAQQAKQLEQYQNTNPSVGQENSIFTKVYIFDSWEIFIGFFARILNINVATFAHTICPIILISIAYMSYYLLLRKIDKKNAILMLLLLAWIFLFSGVSQRFKGYTLLVRIWQGKTIINNIFLPYILYLMCDLCLSKRKIILLMLTNIASLAFSPIAMWMFPLLYFFFTIVMLFKKQIKNVFKMILVILPNLILLPIYLKLAVSSGEGTFQVTNYIAYIDCLKDFIRDGKLFIILYFISLVYVIIKGNKKVKILFVIIPIITFLTVLNPFATTLVQKYITSSEVYWRLFWLIPFEITIAYTITQLIVNRKHTISKILILIVGAAIIVFIGKDMYISSKEFHHHINTEKIQQYVIEQTNFIVENSKGKVMVMSIIDSEQAQTMRQLSSNIILFASRSLYMGNIENIEEKLPIYYSIYETVEKEKIYEAFAKYDIDFIILSVNNKELLQDLDEAFAKIIYEDENNIIIANMQSENILLK